MTKNDMLNYLRYIVYNRYNNCTSSGITIRSRSTNCSNVRAFSVNISRSRRSEENTPTNYFNALSVTWKNFDRISKTKLENILQRVSKDKCNSEQGLMLLKCTSDLLPDVAPVNKAELTLSAWKIIKNAGPVTLEHYHALLSSLSALQYPINTDDIVAELRKDGLEPNDATYLKLLECVCETGDVKQATKILSTIKHAGFTVNQAAFNAIIVGHGKLGDAENMEETLRIMHDTGIDIGPDTYTSVLRSYSRMGDELNFKRYFDQCKSDLTDLQRLFIIKSLCDGKIINFISQVLKSGTWNVHDIQTPLIHTIIELTHSGHVDVAFSIVKELRACLPTSSNSEATFALFFIQEMIKANTPVQKVIDACEELMEYNSYALHKATEAAIQFRTQEDAVELLKVFASRGHLLRPHYFWPLIIKAGESSGEIGVFEVLKVMLEMNVKPDHETLTDWFLPRCNSSQPIELVRKLQDCGLRVSQIHSPLLSFLLMKGNLKLAAFVCKKFKSELDWKRLMVPLIKEYLKTNDIDSFDQIIEQIHDQKFGDEIILYCTQKKNNVNKNTLAAMINVLEKRGFQISNDSSDALRRLNDTDIESRNYISMNFIHPRDMNAEELENHVIELKNKGMNTRGALRLLLQLYCRNKELEKALRIIKELDDNRFELSPGMKSSIIEIYMQSGQLEEAENCLKELISNHPNFKVDNYKFLNLAKQYVDDGKYERAMQLLRGIQHGDPHSSILKNCTRLLNAVADQNGPAETREMFNLLMEKNVCSVSNATLGPLVGAYLKRDDLAMAVELFEEFVSKYRCTPFQSSLMIALIQKIEKQKSGSKVQKVESNTVVENEKKHVSLLERVCAATEKIHGVENTNVSLYIALAKVGAINRIKKMFLDPNWKLNSAYLLKNCQRLTDQNELDTLRNIASTLNNPNKKHSQVIFEFILNIYIRRGDCDGALNLWTELQERDMIVSEKFLENLKSFLVINKRQVPFSITDISVQQS